MARCVVVMRKLPGHDPVAMGVILPGDYSEVDDQDHYMESKAKELIAEFKRLFVEFRNAEFFLNPTDTY